jgi:hypothetical protein
MVTPVRLPCGADRSYAFDIRNGAVERTRTSTDCSTATSTLRVYQFRHNRSGIASIMVPRRAAGIAKASPPVKPRSRTAPSPVKAYDA